MPVLKSLFLQAPSFDGYDGGAGARYQMKREVKSFWYPTWIAQPAAMIEGSKLIDAPAHDQTWEDIAHEFDERDLVILHTSTPSFGQDIRTARLIKERNPKIVVAFVGAKVMIEDRASLEAGAGRGPPAGGDRRHHLARARRLDRAQQGPRANRGHGRPADGLADLSARP